MDEIKGSVKGPCPILVFAAILKLKVVSSSNPVTLTLNRSGRNIIVRVAKSLSTPKYTIV